MHSNSLESSVYCGNLLSGLARLSSARSFSLSAENPTGGKGQGGRAAGSSTGPSRILGQGWKVKPCLSIPAGTTATIADIGGPGAIRHIWFTPTGNYRHTILRFFWDGEETPSVEVPIADFFASAYTNFNTFAALNSLPVCVNPGNAFNCYWEMPFRKHCRITVENIETADPADASKGEMTLFYQIDGEFGEITDDCAYFCAQFRRTNPLPYKDVYTIVDRIKGRGHYVGTYLAWQVNSNGWWGEGEIKFYLDGDLPDGNVGRNVREHGGEQYPTICGTGTEDYFCGSYNFENKETKQYQEFTTAYAGMPHVVRPDGVYRANTRFSLYRWHLVDPVRFHENLAVTIQALGWRDDGGYLPLMDDIASVAFWYQQGPRVPFPSLPSRDELDIH
jgi:hypothetical protein